MRQVTPRQGLADYGERIVEAGNIFAGILSLDDAREVPLAKPVDMRLPPLTVR